MTYRYASTRKSCRKAQEQFWGGFPGRVVWVTEVGQKGQNRAHNHALIKVFTGDADYNLVNAIGCDDLCHNLWHRWAHRYGRAEFAQYDSKAGALYLSKYMSKQAFDWDINYGGMA